MFIFRVLRGVGIGAVGVSAVVEIIRFNSGAEDTGRYVRVGLLLFIICYGLSSLERSIETVRLGVKAEVISHLAYQDGLTELGNRTLFNERLAALEEQKQKGQLEIAITMFDVNDLKKVNDQMGHQYGDQLIIKAAGILVNTQLENSEIIRTDGNEFLIYLIGYSDRQVNTYVNKISKEMKNLPHEFGAAVGFSMITDEIKTLDDAINEATLEMISDKEENKA